MCKLGAGFYMLFVTIMYMYILLKVNFAILYVKYILKTKCIQSGTIDINP